MKKNFVFLGIAISAIVILFSSSAPTATTGQKWSWEVTSSGVFETAISGKRVVSGNFLDPKRSSLIIWDGETTPAFRLIDLGIHGWEAKKSFDVGGIDFENTPWLAADVDGDGLDEILFFPEGSLFRLDLDETISTISYVLFPKTTTSVVSIQADEDPSRELVLAYHAPGKENSPDGPLPLWIGVWDFDEYGCKFLWTDEGTLGLVDPGFTPADSVICAGDLLNNGNRSVLVWRSQSDVSPSRYLTLILEDRETALGPEFSVVDGIKKDDGAHDETPPFVVGDLYPLELEEKTYLLATMVGPGFTFSKNVILLEEAGFVDLGPVAGADPRDTLFWFSAPEDPRRILRLIPGKDGEETVYETLSPEGIFIEKWQTISGQGFKIDAPRGSSVSFTALSARIDLPRTPGTMLEERSVTIRISDCDSSQKCFEGFPETDGFAVNELVYRLSPGRKWEADMGGKRFFLEEYAAFRDGKCIRLTFRMMKKDLTGFTDDPPRPEPPEEETDTAVFRRMLESFSPD